MTDKSTFLISRRYWYLSIIGILPEYQGQGLGANLVTAILKKQTQQVSQPIWKPLPRATCLL